MSGYRRFVAYVYEYRKGKKGNNCGFIKVEVREQRCTMEIHLHCTGLTPQAECKVYGFIRKDGLMNGILLGSCETGEDTAECLVETDSLNMGGSGISLGKMGGMVLVTELGGFFGTEWDDQPIRQENFQELQVPPGKSARKREPLPEPVQPEEPLPEPVQPEEPSPEPAQPENPSPEPVQPEEPSPEPAQPEEPLPEPVQPEEPPVQPEEPPSQPEPADSALYREVGAEGGRGEEPPELSGESVELSREPLELSRESGETEIMEDSAGEAAREDSRPPMPPKPVPGPHPEGGASSEEEYQPFEDGELVWCRKIQPKDFAYFSRREAALRNNRFLLYGYYNFGHLMLGKKANGQYILGVPGSYDQQERFMANMFGFPYFKESRMIELPKGRGGYWYRLINAPNFH